MAVARRRAKLSVMDWATSFVGPALDRWSISIETSRQTTGESPRNSSWEKERTIGADGLKTIVIGQGGAKRRWLSWPATGCVSSCVWTVESMTQEKKSGGKRQYISKQVERSMLSRADRLPRYRTLENVDTFLVATQWSRDVRARRVSSFPYPLNWTSSCNNIDVNHASLHGVTDSFYMLAARMDFAE